MYNQNKLIELLDDANLSGWASMIITIEKELEQHRREGTLNMYIRGMEILFEKEKLSEICKLLTVEERQNYKMWSNVEAELHFCRTEFSETDLKSRPVEITARNKNIYKLLQSYESEGKTSEIEMALSLMNADEKKAYKAKKNFSHSTV